MRGEVRASVRDQLRFAQINSILSATGHLRTNRRDIFQPTYAVQLYKILVILSYTFTHTHGATKMQQNFNCQIMTDRQQPVQASARVIELQSSCEKLAKVRDEFSDN